MSADDDSKRTSVPVTFGGTALTPEPDEPPVVARMIVEIRADGTRTIARGAIEDVQSGERVAVQAEGSTPLALAASLAKTLFSAPALAKQAAKALLESRFRK
jgi:hypothetical protein